MPDRHCTVCDAADAAPCGLCGKHCAKYHDGTPESLRAACAYIASNVTVANGAPMLDLLYEAARQFANESPILGYEA